MKRWTKQEFIEAVDPCGFKFRIWWFFLWHKYVTLLDVANAKIGIVNKHYLVYTLAGARLAKRCFTGSGGFDVGLRRELKKVTAETERSE